MSKLKLKTSVESFLPKERGEKSHYTMVKFNKRLDLLEFLHDRVKKLGTNKNAYILALIEMDKESQNGKG